MDRNQGQTPISKLERLLTFVSEDKSFTRLSLGNFCFFLRIILMVLGKDSSISLFGGSSY